MDRTEQKQFAVVDWGMGNVGSVTNALERIGCSARVTKDPAILHASDGIILPGVGAFKTAMQHLEKDRLVEVLRGEILENKKPFLGICLGMQVLGARSEEDGDHEGLNWLAGSVKRLTAQEEGLRLPHMGWNDIAVTQDSPLFEGIRPERIFYFVHSYHLICDPAHVLATCRYGETFAAVIQKENIVGTQFHPERSHTSGLQFLKNFVMGALQDEKVTAC